MGGAATRHPHQAYAHCALHAGRRLHVPFHQECRRAPRRLDIPRLAQQSSRHRQA